MQPRSKALCIPSYKDFFLKYKADLFHESYSKTLHLMNLLKYILCGNLGTQINRKVGGLWTMVYLNSNNFWFGFKFIDIFIFRLVFEMPF